MKKNFLFYKNIKNYGGAEVLLLEHYRWLKTKGEIVNICCFEFKKLNELDIDDSDIILVKGKTKIIKVINLIKILFNNKFSNIFCHSGPVEFGIAALISQCKYGMFLHQPTTMSFNELSKFSFIFWNKYKNFVKKDDMFLQINALRSKLNFKRKIYIELRTIILQLIYKYAYKIFVLSNYAVEEKYKIFGLKAFHLKGAITKKRADNIINKTDIKKTSTLIKLVTISRLDKNKRIDIIIKAVNQLIKKGYNVNLKIGGKGPAENHLKNLVLELGLNQNITFLGFVEEKDLAQIYKNMDIFTTIDWADYRITTYEVLSENRPVIVSDDTDLDPELLNSGYLFQSKPDFNSLAKTIEYAINHKINWNKEKLSRYLEQFTWERYFKQITFLMNS